MIFGTFFTGRVKTQNEQFIETKIFSFIIPIYPISSMLVTETLSRGRRGIDIMKNKLSVIAAILRILSTFSFLFFSFIYHGSYSESIFIKILRVIIPLSLAIYFWFFFGKTKSKEKFVRNQFGKIFGLYFMPEWLYLDEFKKMNDDAKKTYRTKNSSDSWIEKLNTTKFNDDDFALIYCISYFENILNPNKNTSELLERKYQEYLAESNHK
jgi:hypothetical protein